MVASKSCKHVPCQWAGTCLQRCAAAPRTSIAAPVVLFVVLFFLDSPFKLYFLCSTTFLIALYNSLHAFHVTQTHCLAVLILCLNTFVYCYVRTLELPDANDWDIHLEHVDKSQAFFRPVSDNIDYDGNVTFVNDYINARSAYTLEPLPIKHTSAYTFRALQFEFFLRYWADPRMTAPFACLIESDVAVDMDYVARRLRNTSFDLAHVQHFWGHQSFERYNNGVHCVRKDAPALTRAWVALLRHLFSRRYQRMVSCTIFYSPLRRLILKWDADHGCTLYRSDCHYIHFTQPKEEGIAQAVEAIQARQAMGMPHTADQVYSLARAHARL